MKGILALLAAAVFVTPALALSPTELGGFLAGRTLPPESPLAVLQDSPEYREHARLYAAQWYRYDDLYFAPMRMWSSTDLVPRIGPSASVTYPFSGPDLISALGLFPDARLFSLMGLEPIGRLANPLELPPDQLHASLAALRKSTEVIMNFSHFITKDMKTELAASHFQGVFPILLVFLSFTDARIDAAERLTLNADGSFSRGESSKGVPALRIAFRSAPGLPPSQVFYFQTNLADSALKDNSPVLDWIARQGTATGYMKAASYLPHEGSFSRIRDFMLSHSRAIVQDDSGIPVSVLRSKGWNVISFGNYTTPLDIFSKYHQPDLRSVFDGGGGFPLPFGFGYRWQKGQSTLLLALPPGSAPRAMPVPLSR